MGKFRVRATIDSDEIVGNRTGKTYIFLLKTYLHPIFPCEKFFTLWVAMEYQLQKKYVMEKVSAL